MRRICGLVLASLLALNEAHALQIEVENTTSEKVVMAFSYFDNKSSSWMVDGWYNLDKKAQATINLPTVKDDYYLYAEFSNGKKIEGAKGDERLNVTDKAFLYDKKNIKSFKGRFANFVKAKGENQKALIRIK